MSKHYLLQKQNGRLIRKTVRDWARENQEKFPSFKFINGSITETPTPEQINAQLKREGFNRGMFNGDWYSYNLNEIGENDLRANGYISGNAIINNVNAAEKNKAEKDKSNFVELKKIYNQKKSRFNKNKQLFTVGFSNITFNEFNNWVSKTNQKCHYCGLSNDESKLLFDAQRNKKRADSTRNGKRGKRLELDRKEPNETYDNLDNLVWCCYWCNNAKSNFFTEHEFKPIGKVIGTELKKIISNL